MLFTKLFTMLVRPSKNVSHYVSHTLWKWLVTIQVSKSKYQQEKRGIRTEECVAPRSSSFWNLTYQLETWLIFSNPNWPKSNILNYYLILDLVYLLVFLSLRGIESFYQELHFSDLPQSSNVILRDAVKNSIDNINKWQINQLQTGHTENFRSTKTVIF